MHKELGCRSFQVTKRMQQENKKVILQEIDRGEQREFSKKLEAADGFHQRCTIDGVPANCCWLL
ncbi:hypothetical protein SAMN04487897_11761 [Paenibacillus sp. yr247]|nr:hypothetical protein SAMN04487897_11761 [Paenibacillus sp. yr247]